MTDQITTEAVGFDFSAPAELYLGRGSPRRHGLRFKQFDTAAEAIRYAMERPRALGEIATMECDDKRFGTAEIAGLYHDQAYPLTRLAAPPRPRPIAPRSPYPQRAQQGPKCRPGRRRSAKRPPARRFRRAIATRSVCGC